MRTDVLEVVEKLPLPSDIKVHSIMCTQLMKVVEQVVKIFPEIEAARPRCQSGIQSLCLLNGAIDKAKSLLHDCSDSSKLYLALTGSTILTRFKKSKNLLEQSLSQIQNLVPVMLASEISRLIAGLRGMTFSLDPSEEEAGKAVKALLEHYRTGDYVREDSGNEFIQIAALKLQITSQRALLYERRAIKKLLNKLSERDGSQAKKQILLFLFDMLKKYGKSIASGPFENDTQDQDYRARRVDSCVDHQESRKGILGNANGEPAEEFKCPISLKLMYDPVVIDSGQTFERMWIQKWFDEGHDICPKTKKKLLGFSLTPNSAMKDLISKWCEDHKVVISDPCVPDANAWENSCSSINSLSVSMIDLHLPVDYSNISLSSLDSTRELEVESYQELDDALPWEFQCRFVEDLVTRLKHDRRASKLTSFKKSVESIVKFLKVAHDVNDVKAQRNGCTLLQILVTKFGSVQYLNKDAYKLITELLESQVIEEALEIMEVLSSHQSCRSEIAASGAVMRIFKILDTQIREIQTPALKILYHLTLTRTVCSLVSSDVIAKLVNLLVEDSVSRYCLAVLSNLCGNQGTKRVIAETEGCVACVASFLESESHEEQEQALEILVALCSQSVEYCQLVMNEGVIPSVVLISRNGNDKGKAKAFEMLRLLREVQYDDEEITQTPVHDPGVLKDANGVSVEKKTSSRTSRFLSKLSLVQKTK